MEEIDCNVKVNKKLLVIVNIIEIVSFMLFCIVLYYIVMNWFMLNISSNYVVFPLIFSCSTSFLPSYSSHIPPIYDIMFKYVVNLLFYVNYYWLFRVLFFCFALLYMFIFSYLLLYISALTLCFNHHYFFFPHISFSFHLINFILFSFLIYNYIIFLSLF